MPMRFNDEQNLTFANDPRRVAAEKKVRDLVQHIQTSVKSDCANAGYYLSVLHPLLHELEAAYDNLIVVEATVEAEIAGKERFHG